MAALIGRASREALLKVPATASSQTARSFSVKNLSKKSKIALGAAVGCGVVGLGGSVFAGDLLLHPPVYPWRHRGMFNTYDHDSIRRGFEVYKQVCAACHSMEHVYYRELIGVIFNEKEAKAEAAEQTILDGPNIEGNMVERKRKLTDTLPNPYKNSAEAAAANNGAAPPDLTYIIRGRHGGEDYVFSLLTGYRDPPAGVTPGEGQHYNPYFPGGVISMAQALYNDIIEYEDGTPATQSQLAKDVVNFLSWAGEPEMDMRKRYTVKWLFLGTFLILTSYYVKRQKWQYLKTRKFDITKPVDVKAVFDRLAEKAGKSAGKK